MLDLHIMFRQLQGPDPRLAAKDGYPLNALISIRPPGTLTPLEHANLVDKNWNRLGVWSRRHTADHTFHAILVRETVPIDNFHLLMHVDGNANLSLLRCALTR
jgi:transposase